MKTSWLSLINTLSLGMLILSTACQEKVAPELSAAGASAGSTTTAGSGGGSTATNNFTLTLGPTPATGSLPSLLNYQIHKANELISSTCTVENVVDTPDTLDSTRDITCYVEAEEFALYFNGLGLNIAADSNTCEYVVYQPYSFQQWQPGITSRRNLTPRVMLEFTCDEESLNLFGATVPTAFGDNPDGLTLSALCGNTFNVDNNGAQTTWGDLDLSSTSANIENDTAAPQLFCSFDYSETSVPTGAPPAPNCDEGKIRYFKATVTAVDTDADDILDAVLIDRSVTTHECGGNIRNCSAGAMVDEMQDEWIQQGRNQRFLQVSSDSTLSELFSVPSPYIENRKSNMSIANFTRQCSGVSLWNTDASFAASADSYNPDLIAEYSELGANSSVSQEVDSNGFDVLIVADDPFRAGLSTSFVPSSNGASINQFSSKPHYQFLCLDYAYDIKARIRVAVREWNKKFNISTTSLAFISDVYKDGLTTAQMDATNVQTVPHAPWINYNDIDDWDDFLRWDDSGGTASCTTSFMDDGDADPTTKPTRSRSWFPESNL